MIYFDNAATAQPRPEVVAVITDRLWSLNGWFNPNGNYRSAKEIRKGINKARETIANYINCKPEEIIFTSSGSESNSLAIDGFLNSKIGKKEYFFIRDEMSHSSVALNKHGCYVIGNNRKGILYLTELQDAIHHLYTRFNRKPFCSFIGANNEIGTIQDLKRISNIIHNANGILHIDGVQLFANQRIDVKALGIDMLSVSGHKIGCPPGIGFLYVKKDILKKMYPTTHGTQEFGLRGGTENSIYIEALAKAVEILDSHFELKIENTTKHIKNLRDYAIQQVLERIPDTFLVGSSLHRLVNNANICFSGLNAKQLVSYLDLYDICVSEGSACNNNSLQYSHVLKSLGLDKKFHANGISNIYSCIRFSFSEQNTFQEIDYMIEVVLQYLENLKTIDEVEIIEKK